MEVRISQKFHGTRDVKIIEIPVENFPTMKIWFDHSYCKFIIDDVQISHSSVGTLIQDARTTVGDGNHLRTMAVDIIDK